MGWRGSIKKSLKLFEFRGKSVKIPRLTCEDAFNLLEGLKGRLDFEVRKYEVKKVELKKPGIFKGGYVKIKTLIGREHKIGVMAKEEYECLKGLLQEFCPEKLTMLQ